VSESEFSRPVKARHLPAGPLFLQASAQERTALAKRFGVVAVESLNAEVTLAPGKDAVVAEGSLTAELIQTCAVSGEDFDVRVSEPVALHFVAPKPLEQEVDQELPNEEADEIEYEGETFDLGEAIAQTLALAIDPYPVGPDAEAARKRAGIGGDDEQRGPLADLLAGLRKD
jgi:uncharacterized metal-binding protein YceD (DUF177 family)